MPLISSREQCFINSANSWNTAAKKADDVFFQQLFEVSIDDDYIVNQTLDFFQAFCKSIIADEFFIKNIHKLIFLK